MNIVPCPTCNKRMAVMLVQTPQGPVRSLVCRECDHVEPLPVDQQLKLQKARRLL